MLKSSVIDSILIMGDTAKEGDYAMLNDDIVKAITRMDIAAAQVIACFLVKCKDRLPMEIWDSAMNLFLNHVPYFCERYYLLPYRSRISDFGTFLTCCDLDRDEELALALLHIHRDTFEILLRDFAEIAEMVASLVHYDRCERKIAPFLSKDQLTIDVVKSASWWWNALYGSSALNRN